jgi:hypothetical protein
MTGQAAQAVARGIVWASPLSSPAPILMASPGMGMSLLRVVGEAFRRYGDGLTFVPQPNLALGAGRLAPMAMALGERQTSVPYSRPVRASVTWPVLKPSRRGRQATSGVALPPVGPDSCLGWQRGCYR